MKIDGSRWIKHGFDHEHELVASFSAVDDRRRVFGMWRDVTHLANERIAYAIDCNAHAVAVLDRADARFRNESAHFNVLRWQQRHHRFTSGYPFTLTVERVINQTCLRRRLAFLQETPVCFSQCDLVLLA